MSYLTGVKLEKSAQPVSELGLAAGEVLHAASGRTSVEEEDEGKEEQAVGLLGLEVGAVDVPVSMGMSSKLAVHTGPKKIIMIKILSPFFYCYVFEWILFIHTQVTN